MNALLQAYEPIDIAPTLLMSLPAQEASSIELAGKSCLESWSKKTRGNRINLGYPTSSPEQHAQLGGVMSAPSDLTEEELLTDRAVARMSLRHRSVHYRVIRLWYINLLTMPQMIRALRCGRSHVYRQINKACAAFWRVRQAL